MESIRRAFIFSDFDWGFKRFVSPDNTLNAGQQAELNFFNNASGVRRPALLRHQFGGSISGPIRKDKAFFFNYDGFRQSQSFLVQSTALTAQARQGIFRF